MPLSEDEQRILRQIEQELESDPTFSERGYRISRRRLAVLALGLVVGIVVGLPALAGGYQLFLLIPAAVIMGCFIRGKVGEPKATKAEAAA